MHVLISDDANLLGKLGDDYNEGRVWVTVPACGNGLGPVWLPDYLAFQIGEGSHPELAALKAKRSGGKTCLPVNQEIHARHNRVNTWRDQV